MHSHDNGAHLRIVLGLRKCAFEPAYLRNIELIQRSVVQRDEIYAALNPVIVGPQQMIGRVVFQSLGADFWYLQPIRKLLKIVGTGLGRDKLVIADGQANRAIAERLS